MDKSIFEKLFKSRIEVIRVSLSARAALEDVDLQTALHTHFSDGDPGTSNEPGQIFFVASDPSEWRRTDHRSSKGEPFCVVTRLESDETRVVMNDELLPAEN
jgi:hypothetical protein